MSAPFVGRPRSNRFTDGRGYEMVPAETRPTYLALLLGALTIMLNMSIGYELLHAFFWINVGMLLYYVDWSGGRGARMLHDRPPSWSVAPAGEA